MKVLCDENFPRPVMKDFVGHECAHVIALGWDGITNGALLARAEEAGFQVLVTFDGNLPHQNSLTGRNISIYVLKAEGQGLQATRALVPEVLAALDAYQPGLVLTFTNRTKRQS